MGIRELINKIQHDSGFSDQESKKALEMTVKTIAERLTDDEKNHFASQLPAELEDIASQAEPLSDRHQNILKEFMETENIEEDRAKKQLLSAWTALKSAISDGEIRHIKSQLPNQMAELLY